MFSYLSLLVLKAKLIKIFKSIEFGDLVFCCVGNSKIYFDGFASDVYNLVKNSNLKYECSKKIFFIKIDSADEKIIINTVKIARRKFKKLESHCNLCSCSCFKLPLHLCCCKI